MIRFVKYAPLVLALLVLSSTAVYAQYQPPHQKPGPAVDKIEFRAFEQNIAPEGLKAGEMDIYFFNLKAEAAKKPRGTPGIKIYEAPATTISIILNPAPAPEGQLNPFSIKEVRQALQFLVNREFIAEEIYGGDAKPMFTHLTPFDPDYSIIIDVIEEFGYRYDFERAKALISEAMAWRP